MQTEVKLLPKSEILITVEVPDADMAAYEDEAARIISERIDVPGFRKGQAPKAFVMAQIGADAFFQEVLKVALPRSYFAVIKEKALQVISRPDIKVLSKSPFKYEARAAVMPEIIFKGYEKIKMLKKDVSATDKELADIIEDMRKYRANYKPLDRAVAKGDRVEIDFQGFDEGGAALDKTKSVNHPLFVGEETLVPGFEEQLVGMKVGEKKKFPIKFPSDYHHAPLKGKKVHFEVELKRAEEALLPDLNEEFAEKILGQKKSVQEFKEALKSDLLKRKEIEERKARENALLERFLKEAKLDVPPVLVEEEVDYIVEDLKRELERRGLSPETYFEKLNKEKKDLRKEYQLEAEKRVRVRLILNFLFRTLAIDVTDEEMQRAASKLLGMTPEASKEALQKQISAKGEVYVRIRNNLMLEKLFAKFLD